MTAEAITAIGALITSVVSIFFTWQGLIIQKRHNIKSVRPIGWIGVGDYDNDLYVRIENKGIGPMIIKEVQVKHKKEVNSNLIHILPKEISQSIHWTDFVVNFNDRALLPGDELYLIRKKYSEDEINKNIKIKEREKIRMFLKDVEVVFYYSDIYKSEPEELKQNLEWFGRNIEDE